jgi:hypothetical protein
MTEDRTDVVGQTARRRDPFIDIVRVGAVLVVVVGHWVVTSAYWDEAGTRGVNALSVVPWTRLTTWLTQVMPLLFFAGGFANAVVADRFRGDYLGYLRTRLVRLVVPTAVLFAVWTVVGFAVEIAEPPRADVLDHAAFIAAIPMWFLGVYVIVVALAPALLGLHRRLGLWVPAGMVVGAAAVDVAVHGLGVEPIGILNWALVWLLAHQIGFWYRDGRLGSRPVHVAMAATGLVGLVALTLGAGYPVSMVGVPGQPRWNTDPPSLAIVALIVWLVGLTLLLRGPLTRLWRARERTLRALHGRVLTLFLWHVSAIPLVVLALYPLGFPQPETGTGEWWLWRPVWLAGLGISMYVLVRAFGRFEIRARPRVLAATSPVRVVGAGLAVFSLAAAILGSGLTGFSDPFGPGRHLLEFRINAFHNIAHFAIGLAGAWIVVRPTRLGIIVPLVVAALFTGVGWLGLASPSAVGALAWNEASSLLHLAVGGTTLGLLTAFAVRDALRPAGEDRRSSRAPTGTR